MSTLWASSDGPAYAWVPGAPVERLALLFDDGGILVAELDGTIDEMSIAAVRADLPKAARLGRVRVEVLEVEPAPPMVEPIPASAAEILRRVRDMPNIAPSFRAGLDRVLAGELP